MSTQTVNKSDLSFNKPLVFKQVDIVQREGKPDLAFIVLGDPDKFKTYSIFPERDLDLTTLKQYEDKKVIVHLNANEFNGRLNFTVKDIELAK